MVTFIVFFIISVHNTGEVVLPILAVYRWLFNSNPECLMMCEFRQNYSGTTR